MLYREKERDMPCVTKKRGRQKVSTNTVTSADTVREDEEEISLQMSLASSNDGEGGNDALAIRVVKMKLNTFIKDRNRERLNHEINKYVFLGNQVLGEAYALANFHILRILRLNDEELERCFPKNEKVVVVKGKNGKPDTTKNVTSTKVKDATEEEKSRILPTLDRNFFYSCLMACTSCRTRKGTIGEHLATSIAMFDNMRKSDAAPKPDFTNMTQIISDLSISMATMTTNHIQMNLSSRIADYVKREFGKRLKGSVATIVRAIIGDRRIGLEKLFPSSATNEKSALALEVASHLRSLLPDDFNSKFGTHTHKALPLYYELLKSAEIAKAVHVEQNKDTVTDKKIKRIRAPRTFNLLPMKNSYTIGFIPFSNMTMLGMLKRLDIENIRGDGRDLSCNDTRRFWDKSFNLNAVETRNNRFAFRILSDGYAVSVQLHGLTGDGNVCKTSDHLEKDIPNYGRRVSVDPGFSDVATATDNKGRTVSYSSVKYYEDAGFFHSARRTSEWNAETETITSLIPTSQTIQIETFLEFVKNYLDYLPDLLKHRGERGYRKMRFMRYTKRQMAIIAICDMIAPSGQVSEVGFGDWNGGAKSSISRRTSGPIKAVKQELQRRHHVRFHILDEYNSSKTCCLCHGRLTNMRANTTRKKRKMNEYGKLITEDVVRFGNVHKVLHCKSGGQRDSISCKGTTWNRDVNASRNLLLLLELKLQGKGRPPAFCRN